MSLADLRDAFRGYVARVRAFVYRLLDTVPPLRRTVDELVRVEVIDRCMIIAAQGLLALIPLLVVMAAFLPHVVTGFSIDRFGELTGMGPSGSDVVEETVDVDDVRTHTGIIGILITLFSATSFARAFERLYERVWQLDHIGGVAGTRRCFLWLIGWLVAVQVVNLIGFAIDQGPGFGLMVVVTHATLGTLVWLWTMRALLFGRVPWRTLFATALLTALLSAAYGSASSAVMPRYVSGNVDQFGSLGLILAIATWLIGFAAVVVVSAVVGRVLAEDPWARGLMRKARAAGEQLGRRTGRRGDPETSGGSAD